MPRQKVIIHNDVTIGEAKSIIKRKYPNVYTSIGRDEATKARKKYRRNQERIEKMYRKTTFSETKKRYNYVNDLIVSLFGNYSRSKKNLENMHEMWNQGFDLAADICFAKHHKKEVNKHGR